MRRQVLTSTLAYFVLLAAPIYAQITKAPAAAKRIDVADEVSFRAVPRVVSGKPDLVLDTPPAQTIRIRRSVTIESVTDTGRWQTLTARFPEDAPAPFTGKSFSVRLGDVAGTVQVDGPPVDPRIESDLGQLAAIEGMQLDALPGNDEGSRSYTALEALPFLAGSGLSGAMAAKFRSRTEAESVFDVTVSAALASPSGVVDLAGTLTVSGDGTARTMELKGRSRSTEKMGPESKAVDVVVETTYELRASRVLTVVAP